MERIDGEHKETGVTHGPFTKAASEISPESGSFPADNCPAAENYHKH